MAVAERQAPRLGGLAAAQALAKEITVAGQPARIFPPKRGDRGGWVVALEDVLGDRVEKVFKTEGKAMDFYTELWLGQSRTEAKAEAAGLPHGLDNSVREFDQGILPQVSASQATSKHVRREALNLRKVAEVLGSYGLDPSVELAEILTPSIVVDPETGVETEAHRISVQDRSRILLELMQYAHPKLKAVEMKIEGTLASMTQEQIDAKLAALIAKAAKA